MLANRVPYCKQSLMPHVLLSKPFTVHKICLWPILLRDIVNFRDESVT